MGVEPMIIASKITIPRGDRWYLPRPHLEAVLTEGLSRRLTTLIAAAGHGKTCTLAHFVTNVKLPYLWVQLDAADSDTSVLLRYLAHGIRHQLKGGSRLLAALDNSGINQWVPLIVADLADCTEDIIIVLDDFHLIDRSSAVVGLIGQLIQYCGTNVHFYVCSRNTLPFSTARLKVVQDAAEITEHDLRFTRDEVGAYLRHMAELDASESELDQICHLTEGWSAALVLLASSLRRNKELSSLLDGALPADLFSYLTDELVETLPRALQSFMEESSILDTCSVEVCNGSLRCEDAGVFINQLLSSTMLLTTLGPDSFRYHHLLQRFLLERLRARDGGVTYRALHRNAGDWFLAAEQHEEAVKHYLRGGWIKEAADLVELLAPIWLRHARLDRLRSLLNYLPSDTKEQYPWITLCEARHATNSGNPDSALGMARLALRKFQERGDSRGIVQAQTLIGEIYINRHQYDLAREAYYAAEEWLQPDHRYEEGVLLQRRAVLHVYTKGPGPEAETDLRRALALVVELSDLSGEAWVSNLLGTVRSMLGDFTNAITLLERSLELFISLGEPPYENGTNLAWTYVNVGRFRDAIRICEPMLALSKKKMHRLHAAIHLVRAYTRLGEFGKAGSVAQSANALVEEIANIEQKANLTAELAALYRLTDQSEAAVPYANEAMQLAKQTDRPNYYVRPVVEAMLLHLFHTGNNASALRMGEKALARLTTDDAHLYEKMMIRLIIAVASFRQTRTDSRPEAVRILQEALAECSRRGYQFFALHEWPLALCVILYGLAYDVHVHLCVELIQLLNKRLPAHILKPGIPLMEIEAKLIPAAWQALPDEETRSAFSTLLSDADRRRIMNLAVGPSPLRIQCLGALTVTVGTQAVDIKALKKRKSGQLLVLLLCQDDPLHREQVIERLWPDLDPEASDTSLRVTLHHLRRLLEPHLGGRSKSRYIQAEGGLIWFSRHTEVQIDLDQFRQSLAAAEEALSADDHPTAASHYEAACRAYRGDLSTDDPYSTALEDIRNQLIQRFTNALDWLGNYYFQNHDSAKAILAFKQRLTLDEAHEPAHQALMRVYLETGQVASAKQQYAACRESLASQLGVAPSRTTESLLQLAISMEREMTPEPERKLGKKA